MRKIEEFINIKIRNYELYKSKMSIIKGLTLLDYNNEARNNHWFYSLVINDFKLNRDQLLKYLSQNKIQTRPIWKLIHTQKPYLDNQSYKIEKANLYYNKILNIPCSTNLKKESIEYIINTLKKVVNNSRSVLMNIQTLFISRDTSITKAIEKF